MKPDPPVNKTLVILQAVVGYGLFLFQSLFFPWDFGSAIWLFLCCPTVETSI